MHPAQPVGHLYRSMAELDLFARDFGGHGRPLVILHGLFGSHRNWATVAQKLGGVRRVYGLDQRNHGDSPHADSHTALDLVQDLKLWLERNDLRDAVLMGHSMGGLVAMNYALHFPERLEALVVVDIAPRAYEPRHGQEFEALSLDVSGMDSRQEIDEAMARYLRDPVLRQFLMMNLKRESEGGYSWKINVPVLKQSSYIAEFKVPPDCSFDKPSLFLTGGKSDFVQDSDHENIRTFFPEARIKTEPTGDHWLHHSAPEWFLREVSEFLGEL